MAAPSRKPRAPVLPKTVAVAKPLRVFRTDGQRLFCDVSGTCQAIGDVLGVSKMTISEWRDGSKVPGPKSRTRIQAEYGVAPTTWDRLPLGHSPPVSDDEDDDDADDEDGEDGEEPSLGEDYANQLKTLRTALKNPDLLIRDKLALNEAYGKALERRRKYELQTEMLEDRIIRSHPAWQRFKRLITDALLAHPAAARDVEAAIEKALDEEDYG